MSRPTNEAVILVAGALLVGTLLMQACGGGAAAERERRARMPAQAESLQGSQPTDNRCAANDEDHEISEYDTSGDEYPDVRKVFLRVGQPPLVNLVLICRESDLNADGTRDVVRYYTDEGRPLREESDRDFNGQMDQLLFYEDGRVVRMEQDTTGNGMIDAKIFYEEGRPSRAERDIAGRSSRQQWSPDRWEYYENGRLVRMGTDLDGDGRVDRWDRDEIYREEQAAEERRQAAEEAAEEEAADAAADDAVDDDADSEA